MAREEGYEANSPRQAFQQAFSIGWIGDEVIWADIVKARNTATHVYRETYAKSLYQELDDYYKAFNELYLSVQPLG
ncbi:MAG TPA: nucleotidyltransferase substrate binding protein [Balneolaceae bacterium]